MKLSDLFYAIVGWLNYPDTSTPVGKTNLRHMDNGILQCAQYILGLSQDKLEVSEAAKFITGWEVDTKTWIVTVTHKDGTVETVDFPIEMMPTKLDLDEDDNLVLVQQDGTTKKISFQRFVYNVSSTATVAMKLDGTTISANVVDGSITADKLEPTLQKTLRQYMLDAQTAAQEAEAYNKSSISYAVGGTGSRTGEDTDNSKYYSEKAKEEAEKAGSYANLIFPEFYLDASTGHLMCKQGKTVTVKVENDHILVEVA
jgi:hypothetical protein